MRTHHGIQPRASGQHLPDLEPKSPTTQIQFMEQFTMSLPNSQSGYEDPGAHHPPPATGPP